MTTPMPLPPKRRAAARAVVNDDRVAQGSEPDGLRFAVAWVQVLDPLNIPGIKPSSTLRVDPFSKEWDGWRVVVAGATVLLVAPRGWSNGIRGADGEPADGFRAIGAAHGWTEPEDVQQVFEIPRHRCLIRYFVARGDYDDGAFADAVRARAIAAPDDATRAVLDKLKAEERAAKEREERAALAATARARKVAPRPTPSAVAAAAPAPKAEDDEDMGLGDEGPETDEDDEG